MQEENENEISDKFPEEHLCSIGKEPWFADLANYLVTRDLPTTPDITRAQRMKIRSETKYYFWDDPYMWKMGTDQVIRRCIPD
ncbi:hypothetical protein AAHA92_33918 [Salvia divinorum]|uniref:Uncharacterized protein n=1 Tax=Salvia divinorum TaxID=28513 RepID=A0ABD1FI88_SALDI